MPLTMAAWRIFLSIGNQQDVHMKSLLLALAAALVGTAAGLALSLWRFGLPSTGDPFDLSVLRNITAEGAPPPPASGGQPRLWVIPKDDRASRTPGEADPSATELVFDFGVMPQHASNRAEFIFRNVGDATLELKKGKSTCQCTVSELSATVVEPKEETVVGLSWKTDGPEGPFRHRADIMTNDPSHRTVHLVVKGTLTRGLAIDPRELPLGRIGFREGKQVEFTIVAFQSDGFEIPKCALTDPDDAARDGGDPLAKLAEFSQKKLTPQEVKSIEPQAKSGYRLTFSLKPGLPLGRIDRKIRVTTNVMEPLELPVSGTVVGDISVAEVGAWVPQRQLFHLGEMQSDQGAAKSLYLIVGGANHQNVQVKVKQTIPAELQAKIGTPQPGGETTVRWPITISIPPGTRAMSRTDKGEYGKIILETTHPDHKEFVIDVSFLVLKASP
jgi:hypothetical protein